MPAVSRRELLFTATTCATGLGLQAQNSQTQTFLAGLVPGRPPSAAGSKSGASGSVPGTATPPTPAARIESFWRACDECATLGVHNIEVNNTFGQIVQTYDSRLSEFKEEMSKRKLRMLGFAIYSHLHRTELRQEMIDEHVQIAKFLKAVDGRYIAGLIAPAAHLGNGDEESYRKVDVKAVVANCNEIGKRVKGETGIDVGYHPEQGDIRAGFWDRMVDGTDPRYYNFWPDVGHLQACGVDPLEVYKKYRSRMVGTHLRDFAPAANTDAAGRPERGRMVAFGEGIIKLPELVKYLKDTKFTGCVMGEGGAGSQAMRNYMVEKLGLKM